MEYTVNSLRKIIKVRFNTYPYLYKYKKTYIDTQKDAIEKISKMKNTHNDMSLFLFANGPSLNKIDPNKINKYLLSGSYHLFAINSFISTQFANILKPDYYLISDHSHFNIGIENIQQEKRRIEIRNVIKKISQSNMKLWVPLHFYRKARLLYPKNTLFGFVDSQNIFSNNVLDITKPRGYFSMTAYKALSVACFLGYKKIYIIGYDNNTFKSVHVDKDNNIYEDWVHFYDDDITGDAECLVDKEGDGSTLGEYLYSQHLLFKYLEKFKNYPIVNLDENSLVDCFPKYHDLDVYN